MRPPADPTNAHRRRSDTRFADIVALALSLSMLLFVFGALIITRG